MTEWVCVGVFAVVMFGTLCWSLVGDLDRFRAWLESFREEKRTRMARALLRELDRVGPTYRLTGHHEGVSDWKASLVWYTLMVRANEIGYAHDQIEKYGEDT